MLRSILVIADWALLAWTDGPKRAERIEVCRLDAELNGRAGWNVHPMNGLAESGNGH